MTPPQLGAIQRSGLEAPRGGDGLRALIPTLFSFLLPEFQLPGHERTPEPHVDKEHNIFTFSRLGACCKGQLSGAGLRALADSQRPILPPYHPDTQQLTADSASQECDRNMDAAHQRALGRDAGLASWDKTQA